MTGLSSINSWWPPLVSRLGSSGDNQGEEAIYGGMGHGRKRRQAPKKPLFQKGPEGAVSADVWKNYADLASLMDAVSYVQTQQQFLEMAEKALNRMRTLNDQSNRESPAPKQAELKQEYLALAGFLAKLSQKSFNGLNLFSSLNAQPSLLEASDLMLRESPVNGGENLHALSRLFEVSQEGKTELGNADELEDCAKLIARRKHDAETHLIHLQKLVDLARMKIENLDHCYLTLQGEEVAKAQTKSTRQSILDRSRQAMLSQTTFLPQKALHLIDF